MPYNAYRILVLDPNDNDALFSAGEGYFLCGMYMDNGCLYNGTIIGIDGRAYGIPYQANLILKCYPPRMIFVGREGDESFFCSGGDFGRVGCVYTVSKEGQVVKIDTAIFALLGIASTRIIMIKAGAILSRGLMDASTVLLITLGIF